MENRSRSESDVLDIATINCEYYSDSDDNEASTMGGAVIKSSTSSVSAQPVLQYSTSQRETMHSTSGMMSVDLSISISEPTLRQEFHQYGRSLSEHSDRIKSKDRDRGCAAPPPIPEYSPRFQKNSTSSNAESSGHSSSAHVSGGAAGEGDAPSSPANRFVGGINLGAKIGLAQISIPRTQSVKSIGSVFSDDSCLVREFSHGTPTARASLGARSSSTPTHAHGRGAAERDTDAHKVCCVFDFDCTLSSSHVYHFINYHRKFLTDFHNPSVSARETRLLELKRRLGGLDAPRDSRSADERGVNESESECADSLREPTTTTMTTEMSVKASPTALSLRSFSSSRRQSLSQPQPAFVSPEADAASRPSSSQGESAKNAVWTERDHEQYKQRLKVISDKLKHSRALTEEERDVFIEETFGGEERLCMLRSFLEDLKHNKHFKLVIASKGDKRHILHCLKIVELDDIFDERHVFDFSTHKADLLMKLFQKNYHVVYFDDTPDEHRSLYQRVNLMKLHDRCSDNFDVFESHASTHYVVCKTLKANGSGISSELVNSIHGEMERFRWFLD